MAAANRDNGFHVGWFFFSSSCWHKKSSEWVSIFCSNLKESFSKARKVVGIQTFQVIVAQGVVGTFSGASLAFLAMWLELVGYSHQITAIFICIRYISAALGGLIGGRLGDILSTRLPNVGRVMLAQIGTSIGVPLAAVLFLSVSNDTSKWLQRAVVFCILGFLTSWCATATNNPIFAEIVPSTSRTMIYALDRSFESLLASFAPTVVGLFAERLYGYVPIQKDGDGKSVVGLDQRNAVSLARALFTAYSIPYAMCCLIYSFLYCTYPKDRDQARAECQMGSTCDEHKSLHVKIVNNRSSFKKEKTKEDMLGYEQSPAETELLLLPKS
ncbi:hypothetical protein O6H91_02G091100 [Diphasiastrum complanatum]|uniref:Uncharacterized protein n=1 Tax=Diphasiastrum complanatum TaxID=34168 RepID=A0ACC2EI40_DIPCM|nr:hypothetical protein O6H91_02G091100 [Diphasiastrum complanatum]